MRIRNALILLLFVSAFGQNILNTVPVLYESGRLDELQELLPDLVRDYAGDPTVMFLQGVFETDALTALSLYERVYTEHPHSEFADDALIRVGQYQYTVGNYDLARQAFSTFVAVYPESGLLDRAQYMLCSSIYGQGKIDSARVFLSAFVKNVKSSPYVDLAIIDLENPDLWKTLKTTPAVTAPDYKYSIQIGAFSVQDNALKVKDKFKDQHYVEIRPKTVRGITFYTVWIGRFTERDEAEKYAETYIGPYHIDYKIVRR